MRKFLISVLLAGAAAAPAIAAPNDAADRQQAREERQQAREERQAERQQSRAESAPARPSFSGGAMVGPDASPRQQRVDRPQFNRPDRPQGYQGYAPERNVQRDGFDQQRSERIEQVQQRFEQRAPGARVIDNPFRDRRGDLRQSTRPVPNVMRNPHPLVVSNTPRRGTQPPMPTVQRTTPQVQWNNNWRHDHRYDWQDYRRHHRSRFHIGFYYDPFGWGYFPYQIGWRLWPSYYSQNYWISDPWMYRLPYAPPGYRWIRYWNDALLVDTWTGEVVDVIPSFFW
jgi:hypothetical protein